MMKRDPIEALDRFYSACHEANEPAGSAKAARFKLFVPTLGVGLGIAAAFAITALQPEPSAADCEKMARALAQRQLPSEPQPHSGLNLRPKGRKPWSA
jgi:hypothetical protein